MLKENEGQEQNCVGLTVQREARCTNSLLGSSLLAIRIKKLEQAIIDYVDYNRDMPQYEKNIPEIKALFDIVAFIDNREFIIAKKYEGLPRYVLETDYGCYSDYGWTIACTRDNFEDGKSQYDHWSKTNGNYRLVDGETGEVLLSGNT